MATTNRSTLGRERRSTAPTSTPKISSQTPRNGRPSPSTTNTTSDKEKHIPNYLKPTICSRNESFKLVKKNGHDDQKFLRRRSFDSRPPSSSLPSSQRPLVSPRRRDSSGPVLRDRKITLRSTSYSDATRTTSSKTVKAQPQPQPLPSRRTKKPTKEYNASPSILDHTTTTHDQSLLLQEMVKVETDVVVHSDLPEAELIGQHYEVNDTTQVNNSGEDEKSITSCDISTVPENGNLNAFQPAAAQIEETIHIAHKTNEVDNIPQQESKENAGELYESSNSYPEESTVEEEAITAVKNESGPEDNNANEELASTEQVTEEEKERNQDKEEQGEEVSEEIKAKEEQVEGDGENRKSKQENVLPTIVISKPQDQGQGKKESPAAYNDVIEETASRLLEKRKNKVKALVGAFETVIDYESSSTPK